MNEQKFIVRPVKETDFSEWFRLRKSLWDESSEEEHLAEMRDIIDHVETQLVLVAVTENDKIIGFLEASIRPFVEDCHTDHVGYLEGWYVEMQYRRHGIGKVLVQAAEKWARIKGCEEMASDAEMGNDLSLTAHTKLGYEESSRLIHLRKDLI